VVQLPPAVPDKPLKSLIFLCAICANAATALREATTEVQRGVRWSIASAAV
jgi:hypothetical protein